MPSAALREWMNAPAGLLETIIECRAFAATYHLYEHATDKRTVPDSPMLQLLKEIEFGLVKAELEADG